MGINRVSLIFGLWISLDLIYAGITKTDLSLAELVTDVAFQNATVAEVTLLLDSPNAVNVSSKKDPSEQQSVNRTIKTKGNRTTQDGPIVKYIVVPNPRTDKDLKAAIQNATSEAVDEYLGSTGGGLIGGGTQIYIIAIVGVLPAAGAAIWCVKWTLRKRRKAKGESATQEGSEPSSTSQPCTGLIKSYVKAVQPNGQGGKGNLSPPKQYTDEKYYKPSWQQYQQYHHQKVSRSPSTASQAGSKWEFPKSQLQLREVLGEGNFGQVWRAEAKKLNGMPGVAIVAVKTVKPNASYKDKQDILKELEIMQNLGRHHNVVTLLACCTKQEPFYLIMEFVVRGKLLSYLRGHRSNRHYYNCHPTSHSLTSRDLTLFAYQVAQGMEYITSKGIVHRDLATRNVLVDHNQVCKIADFGLARNLRDQNSDVYEQKSRGALPIRWMAPESLYLNVFTTKSDVWAFGILLWEVVTLGSTPYPGMGPREVIHYVREGHVMERPHHCRGELYRVMRSSWSADPKDRPSFSSLKKDLGRLLELQMGYIDLEHFPENCYYNLYQSPGERV